MADRPPAKPGAVKRAEALMTPQRGAATHIPTLTDVVSAPGPATATTTGRPLAGVARTASATPPPFGPAQRRALEDAVFERLRARIEAEVAEALAQRVIPEIEERLREAIPAAVEQTLREGVQPRRP